MSAFQVEFPEAQGLASGDSRRRVMRGAVLINAVAVLRPSGRPLLSPPSGPGLKPHNLIIFTTKNAYTASLEKGLLRRAKLPGIRPASPALTARLIHWAAEHGVGVMVDPVIEDDRVLCGVLVNAQFCDASGLGSS